MKIVFADTRYSDLALARVDSVCDAARLKVVGDPVRVKEYEVAEAQAKAYAAAGYRGEVPAFVQVWQEAKHRQGWSARQAADDILAASAAWNGALAALRGLRLSAKEDIRAATGKAEIDAILLGFETTLTTMMEGVA